MDLTNPKIIHLHPNTETKTHGNLETNEKDFLFTVASIVQKCVNEAS